MLPKLPVQLDSATAAGIMAIGAIIGLCLMHKGFASVTLD